MLALEALDRGGRGVVVRPGGGLGQPCQLEQPLLELAYPGALRAGRAAPAQVLGASGVGAGAGRRCRWRERSESSGRPSGLDVPGDAEAAGRGRGDRSGSHAAYAAAPRTPTTSTTVSRALRTFIVLLRGSHAPRRTRRGEDAPVSILKTPKPWIWLLCLGAGGEASRPVRGDEGAAPAVPHRQCAPYAAGVARADLDKQPTDVRRMFDAVAKRYDVTNDVLSLGQDRRWRNDVIDAVGPRARRAGPRPRRRHRHVEPAVRRRAAPTVVPCDFSLGMLQVGKQPARTCRSPPATAPGCRSPTTTFDAVTISFGLRNIVDPLAGLREMRRVTRPGGRLVVCEFSHPTWAPFRTVYLEYLMKALPPDRPRRLLEPRTPTSTSPSRSAPGPTSRPRRPDRRRPAGSDRSGATSPAASSPCTAPRA